LGGTNKFRNRCQHLAPMAKKNPDVLEVLISQMGKNRDIDAFIGKGFSVLGHAKPFEPVRNLLHLQSALLRTLQCSHQRYPNEWL
jgi:hypothetical protein